MLYVGGVGPHREICDDIAAKGYEGFCFTPQGHLVEPYEDMPVLNPCAVRHQDTHMGPR